MKAGRVGVAIAVVATIIVSITGSSINDKNGSKTSAPIVPVSRVPIANETNVKKLNFDEATGSRTSSKGQLARVPRQRVFSSCQTVSGEQPGKLCQFPFVYEGVGRNGCIVDNDPDGKLWCSTRTVNGAHINGQWGHCEDSCPKATCRTFGGPSAGKPCIFPFFYGGNLQLGCTTDLDPLGKSWCSTKVDSQGRHIPNGDNWAYCSEECPGVVVDSRDISASLIQTPSVAFDDEDLNPDPCRTSNGASGFCRQPSLCIGASLNFIENNECTLASGGIGVCCINIVLGNVKNIVDSKVKFVPIPPINVNEVKSIVQSGVVQTRFGPVVSSEAEEGSIPENGQRFVEDKGPSDFHLRFNSARKEIVQIDKDARLFLKSTLEVKERNNLTDEQGAIGLRSDFNSDTLTEINSKCPWTPPPDCDRSQIYRSIDGTCNNLKNPNFGRTGTPFQRILLPDYAKSSLDLPRRRTGDARELPAARHISNSLSVGRNPADTDNTVMVMQMGQFIDHDLTHTPNHGIQCCGRNGVFPASFDADKCFPIRISNSDPFWKGKKTCMSFARSLSSPSLKCGLQSREQLNQITHWLDGSNIYGSTEDSAMYLRGSRGKLKISKQAGSKWGTLPSCAPEPSGKVTACDVCGGKKRDCFFSGDFRVNEQLNLIVLHTLFMREHNRLATALAEMNPRWSNDKIYQEARKINVAQYQHIIFKEWLPTIIGTNFMQVYGLWPRSEGHSTDYADNFDPRINNEFSAGAFRFGHSMIPKTLLSIMHSDSGRDQSRVMNMREVFFEPKVLKESGFIDGMVRGMAGQGSQAWDNSFVEDVRNHLFESTPGRGGLDIVALNIQRGRDHGLPGYNKYLKICTGKSAENWSDLRKTMQPIHVEQLQRVYRSIDDIDLYVGGFLEQPHQDSILGPVFKCIIGDQFARLKKGDRFFHDLGIDKRIAFTLPQLNEVRKSSMARIICDNTDEIDSIQPLAFKMSTSRANAVRSCEEKSIPKMNLAVFKDFGFNGR